MARKKKPESNGNHVQPHASDGGAQDPDAIQRFLVMFRETTKQSEVNALAESTGVELTNFDKWTESANNSPHSFFLKRLNVAIITLGATEVAKLRPIVGHPAIQLLLPEREMTVQAGLPTNSPAVPADVAKFLQGYSDSVLAFLDSVTLESTHGQDEGLQAYWKGYRNGITSILNQMLPGQMPRGESPRAAGESASHPPRLVDSVECTWGLLATKVFSSGSDPTNTGKGVRVAVLDTGLSLGHPDFPKERIAGRRSFVVGESDEDNYGHGTHVAGLIAGATKPSRGPRYSVAPEAKLFIGKVINKRGRGREGDVLAGIEWAVRQKCRIAALPFGMYPEEPRLHDFYEEIGRRAMANSLLLIAAAGWCFQRR